MTPLQNGAEGVGVNVLTLAFFHLLQVTESGTPQYQLVSIYKLV